MRSPMQADASKHAPSRLVSRHSLSVFGHFRRAEAFVGLLSYILPPTVQKDALPQNSNANAARPKPTIRVGTAPHSPPESPKKPVDAAASTGFFVE